MAIINIKQFLFFFAIAGTIIACSNASSQSESSKSTAAAEVKPNGEKIYKQYCITCHGLYGDMGASGAYNLKESKLLLEERIAVITNGRNAMTPFKSLLDKKEIKAVAKYTMELSKQ